MGTRVGCRGAHRGRGPGSRLWILPRDDGNARRRDRRRGSGSITGRRRVRRGGDRQEEPPVMAASRDGEWPRQVRPPVTHPLVRLRPPARRDRPRRPQREPCRPGRAARRPTTGPHVTHESRAGEQIFVRTNCRLLRRASLPRRETICPYEPRVHVRNALSSVTPYPPFEPNAPGHSEARGPWGATWGGVVEWAHVTMSAILHQVGDVDANDADRMEEGASLGAEDGSEFR